MLFGNYHSEPYVQLQGDDRTGEALDGGMATHQWPRMERNSPVLIYAFIYQGVPSWDKNRWRGDITCSGATTD
uniref:Tellurium resistance protein TerA n=1 Tax=Klebsiella pneumoniae TaxID=573 RepID=A0A8B0SVT4_KLEPN|nr:Tellurium resistance protein TerA [Klebsiella pneumoniae]